MTDGSDPNTPNPTPNPYAPPSASLETPQAGVPLAGSGSFDVGKCLSDGWELTWSFFPLWLGVGLVAFLVYLVLLATVIGIFLAIPVLAWGGARFLLNVYEERAQFGDLFSGFENYGSLILPTLGTMLLLGLIQNVGSVPMNLIDPESNLLLFTVGWLFLLFWSVFVTLRVSFAWLIMVDRGSGPIDSIKQSWAITQGNVGKLVILYLASMAVITLGLLALFVGVLPAANVTAMAWVSAYRQMVGAAAAA